MMEGHYFPLQKFSDIGLAETLLQTLKDNDIDYLVDDNSPKFNVLTFKDDLAQEYIVNVNEKDLARATQLMMELAKKESETIGKEHYLYEFTDDELMEVVTKPDEWSPADYVLALKILKERGKEIKLGEAIALKNLINNELAKTEPSQRNWVVAGYIFAIFPEFWAYLLAGTCLRPKRQYRMAARSIHITNQTVKMINIS